ncbi:lymphocyte-specific helicase-like isoform X2 [Sinocyclocheilus rhinocerous]|uniref:Proliferation-associated SNF2-like protein n=1 Tax=Sinocyclocheilus rhinocerous TaxID=307959 RepID=A0A673HJ22_9TELE|nr:PREDICTED: lymphocyte-specific helicase-like isoform X2 [Sinocyclocheilus rhinocerous]XP_016368105.1 PREDICTED: lymphocyte-specific helicase-like isoform X2 [Sinocyclocheilus rhinocerous]XP_016368106.1 PREDICTED: lymphocyte-specific helicase-like isoform X2 [Sinocyclocheilus rhinocerous]XP_016368107.1 PREDICTED: lymphocyte-specific helicase-like isoform X2 [Sinocyclocheilus rhinocerous]
MSGIVKEETRSVSPHCPKPNESEEPEGTAVEESTSEKSQHGEIVITKEMEEEEKHLVEEGEKKEREMMEEARQSWEKDSQEMRFRRLQHLLEKSNIYSKFLLTKMEQQQQDERIKKERLEKKAASQKQKGNDKKTVKVERKKREREDDYKIADVMTKEEILSKAKKPKLEEEAHSSVKLEAEDIEKMSDTNSDIKGRLSETLRENSKQMLDLERTVNGQPVPAQQPKLFTGGVMRLYQVEGIEWLRMLWENGINGILADEMGLGKTIQCIAHIAMMVEKKVLGPFLVVAPLSTLPNWISEFKRFTPEVSVLLYHGPQKERMDLVKKIRQPQGPFRMCPVVVTSFEIAMRDRKILQRFHWNYMIVDEGHRIKNLNCRLVQELKMLMTDNKLLLTGTPLQNNLSELWSLLNFLLPDVFDDLKSFESWFDISTITSDAENIVANEREQNILHMLHQILTPFLLRRLKSDVTLEVPPKKEIVVYAPLTNKQEAFYMAIVNKTIAKLLGQEKVDFEPVPLTSSGRPKRRTRKVVDYYESNTDSVKDLEKYLEKVQKEMDSQASSSPVVDVSMPVDAQVNLKLQNILMLLKRCCNHAYLIEYPLDPATGEFKIDEQLVEASGKFLILDRMLPELKKRGHKVLIFSQMTSILDILMDYCYLRGYDYSRLDGSMSYADRDENMKTFSSDPEVFLFLLSTRAGGLGINLTAADTVIIFDSDWNPQADLQAQDRCHRIGQTKPVMVYRLITANTIDEKILERASAKRKLEKMVIHKNKFKGSKAELKQTKSCVDLNELVELLKSRDYDRAVKGTKGKVISDKDLEILLDRSDLMNQAMKRVKQEKDGVFKVMETKDDNGDISLS